MGIGYEHGTFDRPAVAAQPGAARAHPDGSATTSRLFVGTLTSQLTVQIYF